MSIFTRKTANRTTSLEAFKAKADEANTSISVEKITGGRLADCHTGTAM